MMLRTWAAAAAMSFGLAGGAGAAGPAEGGMVPGWRLDAEPPLILAQGRRERAVEERRIDVGGLERTYYLYAPRAVRGTPAPLVVAFHGGGADPLGFARRVGLRQMADRYGFVVAVPAGIQDSWNTGSIDPQGYAEEAGIDDLGFVSRMLDEILASGVADPGRIYALGSSRGGMMAYHVACDLPGRFAAVAAVSGTLSSGRCADTGGTSLLHIHGTQDERVPFEGGQGAFTPGSQTWASAEQGIGIFIQRAQCGGDWRSEQVTEDTVCSSLDCPGSDEVEVCLVEGGGHAWPGVPITGQQRMQGVRTSESFDATDHIARFFLEH